MYIWPSLGVIHPPLLQSSFLQTFGKICFQYRLKRRYEFNNSKNGVVTFGETKSTHSKLMYNILLHSNGPLLLSFKLRLLHVQFLLAMTTRFQEITADSHVSGNQIRTRHVTNCLIFIKRIFNVTSLILEHALSRQCRKTSTR